MIGGPEQPDTDAIAAFLEQGDPNNKTSANMPFANNCPRIRVPVANLLGGESEAFRMAMHKLAQERLTIAISAMAVVESAMRWTLNYNKERKAFGKRLGDFQNTRFKLAELSAEAIALRAFVDHCITQHMQGEPDSITAALS